MKILSFFAVMLMCSLSVQASDEALFFVPDQGGSPLGRDAFYCQSPQWAGINASDGYDTEIADDIPSSLAGQDFNEITFYVGQWLGVWTDPVGLAVDIYYSQCPPGMVSDFHYEFPWGELTPVLVYYNPSYMTIYEVTASLPVTLTITTSMSVGGYALIDWGDGPPYCGFCPTEWDDPYGCNELYWDAPSEGAPRWTPLSVATGYFGNLAFCLSLTTTPVPDSETVLRSPRLLPGFPNPFNPQTTISFALDRPQYAEVAIYGPTGKLLDVLADRTFDTGSHSVVWNGKDSNGHAVPSGPYLIRLSTESGVEARKVMLVR